MQVCEPYVLHQSKPTDDLVYEECQQATFVRVLIHVCTTTILTHVQNSKQVQHNYCKFVIILLYLSVHCRVQSNSLCILY